MAECSCGAFLTLEEMDMGQCGHCGARFTVRRGGPSKAAREKGALVRRTKKLRWDGKPNPSYKPINLRLPPEKR